MFFQVLRCILPRLNSYSMICLHKYIASHAVGAMRFFLTEVNLTQVITDRRSRISERQFG